MKCFTVDLLDGVSVNDGFTPELLETKTSTYPIVRYANPSLIYMSDPVIKSIVSETGFSMIDKVNIIKTRNEKLLLIPETESEDALVLVINNPVSDIFTGEKKIEGCPHQDHLIHMHDCPLCGVACIDRISVPQIMTKMVIANIDRYESKDSYPRYVHFRKGEIEKYPTFKEGEEENGVTLFDIKEKKCYFKGSYIGTHWFSAIIKLKPNSSVFFRESKYSNSMRNIVWAGNNFIVN